MASKKHPGFKKVAKEISKKEHISMDRAEAILANSSRRAGKKAKKEKLVKAKAPKVPNKIKEVVEVPVKVLLSPDCLTCKGIGLARPDFVASPVCEVCKGSGKQQ